jgi:beta-mannanase
MILKKWKDLPEDMQTSEVGKYYDILAKRKWLMGNYSISISYITEIVSQYKG